MLLEGCQVLDMTGSTGLSCGQLLGDLGATVAHIEPPGGSPARADAVLWATYTRNQHSVVVDLHTNDGRARFDELVRRADIVVDSDDGPLHGQEVGFDRLVGLNPSIVFVSITPFGMSGPKQHYAATDLIVQAAAGNVAITGFADRPPLRDAGITAWTHAGVAAAGAALVGLRAARRTGRPQHVDVSAHEAASLTASFSVLCEMIGGRRPPRADPAAGAAGVVACADGFVQNAVGGIGPTRRFTIRQAEWMAAQGCLDQDVAGAVARGDLNRTTMARLTAAIETMFATRSKADLLAAALDNGFVLAPINDTADVLASAQFAARDVWWHDGDLTMPGPFARIEEQPITLRSTAPALDEHPAGMFVTRTRRRDSHDGDLPLTGLNVLDFGWVLAGPYAGRILADYGATVIKVESATRLDLLRLLGPQYDFGASPDNSASFGSSSAGKQSLAIDLTDPRSRDVILDLVRWADVVCESFAPGAMARLGLDAATLHTIKPELITISSSLFGHTGPLAEMPGYGTQGAAVAGLVLPTGYPDRPPCGPYGPFTDYVAPRYQFLAVLAALEHRDRTGDGTTIDLSQAETGLQSLAVTLARSSRDGAVLDRYGNVDPDMRPHGVYPAAGDDEWVAIAVRDTTDWRGLCDVLERADLAAGRPPDDIDTLIGNWTAARSAGDVERILQDVGIPAHQVITSTSAPTDPHWVARRMIVPTRYGEYDAVVTSTGYHFADTAPHVGPIPTLGQHSSIVLRDLLGYSPQRIAGLIDDGVISNGTAT